MPRILARQQMMMNAAASYPNLDPDGRASIDNMWRIRHATIETPPETKRISKEEYFRGLAAEGFSVNYVEVSKSDL